MVLVDTSVLIEYFKGNSNQEVSKLEYLISNKLPFGINTFIYQEVLQGVKSEKQFDVLKKYLDTLEFYELLNGKESYANAARMYFKCRKAGITVNSTIDFLIVQTILEHNLVLLHNDKDYFNIQKVIPSLKFL
ncbi:MAG: PIN domain nuclease [bacterium]